MDQIHPIVQRRNTATTIIRCVALVLVLIGAFSVLYPIGRGLQTGLSWSNISAIWNWPAWFGLALGTLLPGVCVIVFDRRITRWLVPMPRPVCPECDYDLRSMKGKCPECGLDLAMLEKNDERTADV